jgi:hypothetical protein
MTFLSKTPKTPEKLCMDLKEEGTKKKRKRLTYKTLRKHSQKTPKIIT